MDGEFQIGTWLVQPGLNLISRDGTPVHLEPKVMEVLVCLAQHTGELVSKEELLRTIWRDTFVTEDALKRCVFELRRVFEDDAHDPRIIETIPKRGYRLIAPVIRDGLATIGAPGATESAVISFHKRKLVLAAAAGVLFILAAGGLIWRWRQPRHLTEKTASCSEILSI